MLNGHVFALFGLYDYWLRTGDTEAAAYFDGGATTVLHRMMPLVRVADGVSYYCVQAEFCQRPLWQNEKYHEIHSWQLDSLAQITGDARFTEWASVVRSDAEPPASFDARSFGAVDEPVFEAGVEPEIDDRFGRIEP